MRPTLSVLSNDLIGKILDEAKSNPDTVTSAPHTLPVRRLDDVKAAKQLDLSFQE